MHNQSESAHAPARVSHLQCCIEPQACESNENPDSRLWTIRLKSDLLLNALSGVPILVVYVLPDIQALHVALGLSSGILLFSWLSCTIRVNRIWCQDAE